MEQATQPTTSTPGQDTDRASYDRARAFGARLVDQAQVLPDSVETRRELGLDIYGVRLHFGTGLAAGRGVLATAAITQTEPVREKPRGGAVWIEVRATVDGIPLIARALTNCEDADQLLPMTDTGQDRRRDTDESEDPAMATQPIPTASASPAAVPAVFSVLPLATMKAAPTETTA